MKEFLQQIEASEILSYIFPGIVLVASLTIWIPISPGLILGPELAKSELAVGVFLLVATYALGIIVSLWSLVGADKFDSKALPTSVNWAWLEYQILKFSVGVPPRSAPQDYADGMLEILELIERYFKEPKVFGLPLDWLLLFRTIAADRLATLGTPLLQSAASTRRRSAFALGVALAFNIAAMQLLFRIALHWAHPLFHLDYLWPLLIAFALCAALSWCLRVAGGKLLEQELLLTLAVARNYRTKF